MSGRQLTFAGLVFAGIALVVVFWTLDILVDVYVFHAGDFFEQLVHPEPAELWMRVLIAGLVLAFTVYIYPIVRQLQRANARLEAESAERRQTEATLREAEAKYRSLVEQMPAAVYIWELGEHGACLYVSPQVEGMLGFTVQEWLADPDLFFRQVHPEDRAQAIAAEEHSHATGEPLQSEFRMLTRDGGVIWVRDQSVILRDEAGRSRFNQGILIDITARKQAEESLREANLRLSQGITELEQRHREIALLNQLGELLQACLNVEEAYAVARRLGPQLFPDEAGVFCLISASKNLVEAVAVWGMPLTEPDARVFAPDDCWALRRGQLHLVETPHSSLFCRHVADPSPAACLCMPMFAQGEALGILHLQNRNQLGAAVPDTGRPARLTPAKQQLAQAVGDTFALAVANLRLRATLSRTAASNPQSPTSNL
jgi:PAS domain S-box-containing protein